MKVKQKNGISLIVLVITIIVMIILAASIILALNGSGVIGKAHEAKNKTNEATLLESATLLSAEWDLENKLGNASENAETYITNGLKDLGFTDEQIDKLSISEAGVVKLKFPFNVSNLKEGVFVTYVDSEGNEIPCVVLYDLTSSDNIEIISVDIVGYETLCQYSEYRDEYTMDVFYYPNTNFEGHLNNGAKKYLNSTFASSARSVKRNDINVLSELNIWSLCSKTFWLADSWSTTENGAFDEYYKTNQGAYICNPSTGTASSVQLDSHVAPLGLVYPDGGDISYDYGSGCFNVETYGLRPIFTLLDTVKVISGDGESVATAYKLSAQ